MYNPPRRYSEPGVLSRLAGIFAALLTGAAPFAYACTRPQPLEWLCLGLHGVAFLWVLGIVLERRRPALPSGLLIVGVALISYVWLRFLFGDYAEVSTFTQEHFARAYARWPESMIIRSAPIVTFLCSGLILFVLLVADLAKIQLVQRSLVFSLVLGGLGVVALGLWQNYTHASGIYGIAPVKSMPSIFFGPFYHFTSAGAFINLTWPVAASLALGASGAALKGRGAWTSAVLWTLASAGILVGHIAHISRFPQVIAGGVLLMLLFLHRPLREIRLTRAALAISLATLAIVAGGAIWIAAHAGKLEAITLRWRMVYIWPEWDKPAAPMPAVATWSQLMRDDLFIPADHSRFFLQDRGAAYVLALRCISARPFFGFGPGGWMAAASQYSVDPQLRTFFHYLQFTHEDFLQTVVEWGLIGGALCGFIFAAGLWNAWRKIWFYRERFENITSSQSILIGAFASLCAVLTQSFIDFPLQIPVNSLYASILCGLCWAAESSSPEQPNTSS